MAASLLAVDANETERAGVPFTRTFPIGICCTPTVRATVEIDIVVVANRKHQPGPSESRCAEDVAGHRRRIVVGNRAHIAEEIGIVIHQAMVS